MERMMKTRPTSVTVICWIWVVVGTTAMIFVPLALMNGPAPRALMDREVRALVAGNLLPVSVQWEIGFTKILVILIAGIAMLRGQNWGRLLFTIVGAVNLVITLAMAPAAYTTAQIQGIIVYVVVVFFLFRPKANEYFSGSRRQTAV
jgi:hypothetical protein